MAEELKTVSPEMHTEILKVLKGIEIEYVEHINDNSQIYDVSFDIKAGEILGIAGLLGSGYIRLGKIISGYYGSFDGTVYLDEKEIKILTPGDALEKGISCVSDDRKSEGLVLIRSVKENITLASLNKLIRKYPFPHIDSAEEIKIAKKQINRLNIKVSGLDQAAENLSGGNQQKVVFGKMLESNPKVLILNEPTRGIDIGAKAEIYQIMRGLNVVWKLMLIF